MTSTKLVDWKVDPYVAAITFGQLLSYTSGIKKYGDGDDYESLKKFFTQKVKPPSGNFGPDDPIVTDPKLKMIWTYSNYDFSIFRVLLPMLEGFQDTDQLQRPEGLATQYVNIVQANVFNPLGLENVECKPPPRDTKYAFGYTFPGVAAGHDWGDNTLISGAAGWYLSVEDVSKVLSRLNQKEGKVLSDQQFGVMESRRLGWEITNYYGYRYLEKNGRWSSGGTTISTSIVIFRPSSPGSAFSGAICMNSDVTREVTSARGVLQAAFMRNVRSFA